MKAKAPTQVIDGNPKNGSDPLNPPGHPTGKEAVKILEALQEEGLLRFSCSGVAV